MADPIVFISRNRVKEGMLDDFRWYYSDSVPRTKAGKPDTLVQLAYVNAEGTEVDIVRVFATPEAMDLQLQEADRRSKATYQFIEPRGVEIYGTPSAFALEMLKKVAGSGIDVSVKPGFIGGFIPMR